MKRYYDTAKRGQAITPSETTIIDSDERVANFFQPTPDGYRKAYTSHGLPFNELIPLPTQAELAEAKANEYRNQRADAYPSLTDQADMAYWDRQNGTATLDDAINAVKAAYPKPQEAT